MQYWEIEKKKAEEKRELQKKYPDLGKIVKYEGEVGVVILGSYDYSNPEDIEEVVRWDTNKEWDNEQYGFFNYQYLDSYNFKYINPDGTYPKI